MKSTDGLTPGFWKDGNFGEEKAGRVLFGQTRDDVEIERWLIEQHGGVRRALVITSGGCAPLTLLDVVSEEILSVDINPAQNRLAELKFTAWRESLEDFETLLCKDGREIFARLRHRLAPHTAAWWDAHLSELRGGVLHCGRLDRFSAFMRELFFFTVHGRKFVERFLRHDSAEVQTAAFAREWNTWRWRTALAAGFNPRLLRLTFNRSAAGFLPDNFSQILGGRLRHWLTAHPACSNPHLWQSFLGTYPPDRANWPRYFQPAYRSENLSHLGKITLQDGDVAEVLRAQKTESLEFVSLSNVLELVPDSTAILAAAAHAVRPGGLLLSRGILPRDENPPPRSGWRAESSLRCEAERRDQGGLSLPVKLLVRE
jgi:S-adenosylmethionine:diacylglycerol 3-amino-3-carboxypropyl transferase